MKLNIQDHGDAFDWAFAIWYWLSHYHEGQYSDKYMALNMSTEYKMSNIPDIDFDSNDFDDENYRAIENYHMINESNWKSVYDQFCYYMDYDWDKE